MREASEEVVEVTVEKAVEAGGRKLTRRRKDAGEGGGDGLVKWERFLPKIELRVLLVEADDSTRQIISALLRKCCYRVAAVADGLKAWEILKENPESVDLILTEVDLPSISGYALLTLIMEHHLCNNIPIIMMSTHDSVNTVYKCMLKGAADYLVKPLRRNELRNLWQHVWRRQRACPMEDSSRDSSKEAIDFIGASLTRSGECNREETIAVYESRIELDLSLKGPNAFENQRDRPSLQSSVASAFTRYVHRPLQTQCSVSPVADQRKNVAASQGDNIFLTNQHISSEPPPVCPRRNEAGFYTRGDSPGPPTFNNKMNSWAGHSSCPKPIPIKSIPYTSSMELEERRHNSSLTEQNQQQLEKTYENGYEKNQQSLQREAALTKFRMKRKDRCFDKKVRYESRKKLAEQRPRMKGQFVRQVQSNETSNQATTS